MSEEFIAPYLDIGGEGRKLGLQPPDPTRVDNFPNLVGGPASSFKAWDKQTITSFIQAKKQKRRDLFDQKWMQDQKGHGSCNACAAAYVLRKTHFLRGRGSFDPKNSPVLNWEFLYAQINGNRDEGSLLVDGMKELGTGGVPILTAKHKIGTGRIYKNMFTPEEYAAAKENLATGWHKIGQDEMALATAVLSGFPAVVAVHVGRNFTNMTRKGIAGADYGMGNHAVHVDDVEIIDGELAFDHQGSWGLNLHEYGRAYLNWDNHFANTSRYHEFWVCLSTNDGPDVLLKE